MKKKALYFLLLASFSTSSISAAEGPRENKKVQRVTHTQTTILDFFKPAPTQSQLKRKQPSPSVSEYYADDEESDASENDPQATLLQTKMLPSANPKPPYLSLVSKQEKELSRMVLAACNKSETNPDQFRGKIYDLLNSSHSKTNPDNIGIALFHLSGKSNAVPLLAYALLFCKNIDIIRLIAEKSSHEVKIQALECKGALKRVQEDPSIRNPYFAYFFSEKK